MLGDGGLVVLSVVVHVSLLGAIFDVYYKSPLVVGLEAGPEEALSAGAPAKRLLLFVADGLRAQSFYELDEKGEPRAPFLFRQASSSGSWGVSGTRVPTESRPGHVALIAGFFEDVSAVARGWKENPVPFDSLFNRSTHTWSWGSPDILPMFAKGATPGKVDTRMYSSDLEDFSSSNPSKLDTWVFQEFKMQLMAGRESPMLREAMSQSGVVFFLHLLGLDTSGHGYKPHSREYRDGIRVVDAGIAETVKLVDEFFGDNATAYVFTADHGMTDWGSHGAGLATETETPIVVWGPGVRGPRPVPTADTPYHVGALQGLERKDVEQIDIAPLMAALIGKPVPVNSLGKLPLHYLSVNDRYRFTLLQSNWEQMLRQYESKRRERDEAVLRWFFTDFPPLSHQKLTNIQAQIQRLVQQRRYKAAGDLYEEWVPVVREGFYYFHEYDRMPLSALVTALFVAFIALATRLAFAPSSYLQKATLLPQGFGRGSKIFLGTLVAVCWMQSLNLTTVYYCLLLFYLVRLVTDEVELREWEEMAVLETVKLVGLHLGAAGLVSWALVLAFFDRRILSAILIVAGVWGAVSGKKELPGGEDVWGSRYRIMWLGLCLLSLVFPLLPTIGKSVNFVLAAAGPAALSLLGLGSEIWAHGWEWRRQRTVAYLCLAGSVLLSVQGSGGGGIWVPISWALLAFPPFLPLLGPTRLRRRLEGIAVGLLCPYTLMSLSFESLFFIVLPLLLAAWLTLEASVLGNARDVWASDFRVLQASNASREEKEYGDEQMCCWDDWRRAFLFLFFLMLSFFGTGNIASINSFDPSFTRYTIPFFGTGNIASINSFDPSFTRYTIPFFGTGNIASINSFDPSFTRYTIPFFGTGNIASINSFDPSFTRYTIPFFGTGNIASINSFDPSFTRYTIPFFGTGNIASINSFDPSFTRYTIPFFGTGNIASINSFDPSFTRYTIPFFGTGNIASINSFDPSFTRYTIPFFGTGNIASINSFDPSFTRYTIPFFGTGNIASINSFDPSFTRYTIPFFGTGNIASINSFDPSFTRYTIPFFGTGNIASINSFDPSFTRYTIPFFGTGNIASINSFDPSFTRYTIPFFGTGNIASINSFDPSFTRYTIPFFGTGNIASINSFDPSFTRYTIPFFGTGNIASINSFDPSFTRYTIPFFGTGNIASINSFDPSFTRYTIPFFGTGNIASINSFDPSFTRYTIPFFGTGNIASINSFDPSFTRYTIPFFGTGNIASINSFDPSFTRCLATTFDPFLMGGLLLGKVAAPVFLVCLAGAALEGLLGTRPQATLLPLLVCADAMALNFFFRLKDKGSWLDIGMSISHYVIALALTLFALLLTRLSRLLLSIRLTIPPNLGLIFH